MTEVARQFGKNLRRLREGVGISQEELGYRCSLHRTEIGLLERGARVPRVDTLIKIASGLGVRVDCALLGGIRWTPPTQTTQAGGFEITSRVEQHRPPMERAAPPAGSAEKAEASRRIDHAQER